MASENSKEKFVQDKQEVAVEMYLASVEAPFWHSFGPTTSDGAKNFRRRVDNFVCLGWVFFGQEI